MASYRIIGGDTKEYGPVTADDIRQWITEGRLNAQSLARSDDDIAWRTLASFPEFADVLQPAAPAGGVPPFPMSSGVTGEHSAALQKIKAPAIALKVTAILNLVFALWGLVDKLFTHPDLQKINESLQQLHNPQFEQFMQKMMAISYGPYGILAAVVSLIMSVLIWMGAARMQSLRSYEFSVTAAILAIIPCLTPCCFLGLPFGIWALVVLTRSEIKSHFI